MPSALQVATQLPLQVIDVLVTNQIGFAENRNNIGQIGQEPDVSDVLIARPFCSPISMCWDSHS